MTDHGKPSSPQYNPGKGEGSPVGIALLGHGTVGAQVLRLMQEYSDELEHRIGGPLEVKGVAVRNMEKPVSYTHLTLPTSDLV